MPERPADTGDGGEDNQPPPAEFLLPESVPLTPVEVTPISVVERDEFVSRAVATARRHAADEGLGASADFVADRVLQDEFGRVHVKLVQTHSGVPVIGGGFNVHMARSPSVEAGESVTDGLVRGLDIDTTARTTESEAEATARTVYEKRAGQADLPELDVVRRLAVLPHLALRPRSPDRAGDNAAEYEWVLESARLVWEIDIAAALPTFDFANAVTDAETVDLESDAAADEARQENATAGGHDVPEHHGAHSLGELLGLPALRIRIDALTGSVIESGSTHEHAGGFEVEETTGTGYSRFSGQVELDTLYYEHLDRFYLIDSRRPSSGVNVVYDALQNETHNANKMSLFGDANNTWGDGSVDNSEGACCARRQTPAVDVAYATQITWDMFKNVLFRNGFDGQGTGVNAAVHYGDAYNDAHYNRQSKFIVFGDGDSPEKAGNYGLSTVAHEYGHYVWHAAGNASEKGESWALNEGHGDIMGSLANMYRNTRDGQGSRIERFGNLADWRSRVRNPDGYSETDDDDVEHSGLSYWSPTLKDKPEHVAGLPFARAFAYLAEGAPADPDDSLYTEVFPNGLGGIGFVQAAHIWRSAVIYHLAGTPTYWRMRLAFLDAAEDLYGLHSTQYRAVQRAFAGIRVGWVTPDNEDPELTYVKIYDIDHTDMTARYVAFASDDTGFRTLRVTGEGEDSVRQGSSWTTGYLSLMRAPLGASNYWFTIEDSDGKIDTTNRYVVKSRDRNLLENGDFEDDMTGWTAADGGDYARWNRDRAFLGGGYLDLRGSTEVRQQVTIPFAAKNVRLVYRLLVRNSTRQGEFLIPHVEDASGETLLALAAHGPNTSRDGRDAYNRGYIRRSHNLSAFAGQTINIAFAGRTLSNDWRFLVDQVVLTYEEDVSIGVPTVSLHEWDNTVAFQTPEISGVDQDEILSVEYWVDGQRVASGTSPTYDYYGAVYLDALGAGPHWVAARVIDRSLQTIGQSRGVWFVPGSFNELLADGGFESGAWDLSHSDVGPAVTVVQNVPDGTVAFDGQRAVRLGGQGETTNVRVGQVLSVPRGLQSLHFSTRIRVRTDGPSLTDNLHLELWDANTFTKLYDRQLATGVTSYSLQGNRDLWKNYFRAEIALQPGLFAGRDVIVILRAREDSQDAARFYLDNVSLRFTQFARRRAR